MSARSRHTTQRCSSGSRFTFTGAPLDSAFSFSLSSRSPLGVDGTTGGRLLTGLNGGWTTPSTENVNTRSGAVQAANTYRASGSVGQWATEIVVPGYPGAFAQFTAADTLESYGATTPPVATRGINCGWATRWRVLDCWCCADPKGNSAGHRVHAGHVGQELSSAFRSLSRLEGDDR